jgi:hypothetical protein
MITGIAGWVASGREGKCVVYALEPTFFCAGEPGRAADLLALGCWRLELPRQ